MRVGNWLRHSAKKFVGSGVAFKNVLALSSGTALAQVISFIIAVPLARLYSPYDFGLFAIFQSISGIGGTIAALRYDLAIVMPRSDAVARVLERLASRSVAAVALLTSVILLLTHRLFADRYDNPAFGYWLVSAGIVVYLGSQVAVRQYWLTRRGAFRTIGVNRALGAVALGAAQVAAAFVFRSYVGLIVGMAVGQLFTLLIINRSVPELRTPLPPGAPSTLDAALRYKKMPLLNGPNALLDSIRVAGINILIGTISIGGLGQYSLAQRAIAAPAKLIGAAVSQVALQRFSVAAPGSLARQLRGISARALLASAPAFLALFVISPWLIPWVFGAQWTEAGLIVQALVPWLFAQTVVSQAINVFIVAERQGLLLIFSLVQTSAVLGFLAASPLPLLTTIWWFSLLMAFLLGLLWIVALFVALDADKRAA